MDTINGLLDRLGAEIGQNEIRVAAQNKYWASQEAQYFGEIKC